MKAMKLSLIFAFAITAFNAQGNAQLISSTHSGSDLNLDFGDNNHDCRVTYEDGLIAVTVLMSSPNSSSGEQVEEYSELFTFVELEVVTIQFGAGDDYFAIDDDIPIRCVVYAGDGDDLLLGGMLGDQLEGQEGKDVINGAGGNDVLATGSDGIREIMIGGEGKDIFFVPTYCWSPLFSIDEKSGESDKDKLVSPSTDKPNNKSKPKTTKTFEKDLLGALNAWDLEARDAEDRLRDQEPWVDQYVPELRDPNRYRQPVCIEEEEDFVLDFEIQDDYKVAIPISP